MIGKIKTGKSFGGCISYCLNDKKEKPDHEAVMKGRAKLLLTKVKSKACKTCFARHFKLSAKRIFTKG